MLEKLKSGHWPIFIMGSFSSMANLYLPIFLARMLAPAEMGLYKIYFLYLGAIQFLFLVGGPLHSVYYWVGKKEEDQGSYIQQAFILGLFLSSLILIFGFPLRGYIAGITNLEKDHVSLMLVGAFLAMPAGFYGHTKIALGSTVKGSLFDTLFEFTKVGCFISIALYAKNITYIFASFCIIFGFKVLVSLFLKVKEGMLALHLRRDKMREIFGYCLPISLAGLVGFLLDKMDQFILATLLPKDEFAFYAMGCLMIPPLYTLEASVTSVLVPKLSKGWISNSGGIISHYKKAVADIAFLLVPSFFGIFLFAQPIVELLYTNSFMDSAQYLRIFAFTYLILILPYDAVPRATGKTQWVFNLTLVLGLMSLAGILVAARYFGAAETLMVAMSFKFIARIAGIIYSAKIMDWKVMNMFPFKRILVFSSISIALSLGSIWAKSLFNTELQWFLVCAPIFALIYLGLVWLPHKKGWFHEF